MKGKRVGLVAACAVLVVGGVRARGNPPPTLWASQAGTAQSDIGHDIAVVSGGNSYVAGSRLVSAVGDEVYDAIVVACDSGGTVQWTRQFGTTASDPASGIAVDGSGNAYISGYTNGDLGGPNQGWYDAFIAKYDAKGIEQWTRQIGTAGNDCGEGVAADIAGNSYITGLTMGDLGGPNQGGADAFIVKYDSGGAGQWARQIGSSGADWGHDIAVDGSGNSYVTGHTTGDLGGPNQGDRDAFIAKCDSSGTLQWTRQLGTGESDAGYGIAVDSGGHVYITGCTRGDLAGPSHGGLDAFVVKYDSDGTVQWARQIGTAGWDDAMDIAVDGSGNVYITGSTLGSLGGPNQGPYDYDVFAASWDSAGTLRWTRQIGTGEHDTPYGIAADGSGRSYITGYTRGDLGGPNQGSHDVFVVAIASYPAAPGDADLNGCVDGLDYIVWSNNYKLSDQWWEEGDFTGEGYVDGLDYIAWSNNYHQGCAGQIPEPASALLLLLGAWAVRRRRGYKF